MRILGLFIAIFTSICCQAQQVSWYQLDPAGDTVMGAGINKAYRELLAGKRATPVTVAVIDRGIDTAQQDLKPVLWKNVREKTDGKDNDNDGYADDVYGWNFLGSAKGNVRYDNAALTRKVRAGMARFGNKDSTAVPAASMPAYREFVKDRAILSRTHARSFGVVDQFSGIKYYRDKLLKAIGKDNPSLADMEQFQTDDTYLKYEQGVILAAMRHNKTFAEVMADEKDRQTQQEEELNYWYNLEYDPRPLIGDDYPGNKIKSYGNNDVTGPEPAHGTAVASVIAALRGNGRGIDGIADNVKIMSVRAIPNGDERDKDVANAIRYAVDNGARIINLSFSKQYSDNKTLVDESVKYAMKKNVLIVHAAGNDNENTDQLPVYPNKTYADGSGSANAWIEVGASSRENGPQLKQFFSNYGKTTVDVFAPGAAIATIVNGDNIGQLDGTTMAAPIVTGIAALIMEYYPKLSANEVKKIILESVEKNETPVQLQGKYNTTTVPFSELSVSGGIINAYRALKLAAKQ